MLYSALEDFRMDILIGTGPGARTHSLPIPAIHRHRRDHPAGTRQRAAARPLRPGAAPEPLRRRRAHADRRSLGRLAGASRWITPAPTRSRAAAVERRASPTACCAACAITPRCAPTGASTSEIAKTALDLLEVDRFGLDEIDQKIMLTILEKYGGGPVGVEHHRRVDRRRARHHRGSLRTVPDPTGLYRPHAARPRSHRAGLRLLPGAPPPPRPATDPVLEHAFEPQRHEDTKGTNTGKGKPRGRDCRRRRCGRLPRARPRIIGKRVLDMPGARTAKAGSTRAARVAPAYLGTMTSFWMPGYVWTCSLTIA